MRAYTIGAQEDPWDPLGSGMGIQSYDTEAVSLVSNHHIRDRLLREYIHLLYMERRYNSLHP